jgi:hypothetical protein
MVLTMGIGIGIGIAMGIGMAMAIQSPPTGMLVFYFEIG